MEAKYVAACEAAKEVVWLRKLFLNDLEGVPNMTLPIIGPVANITDLFMKALTATVFESHLENLGLRDMYIVI